MKGRKCQIVVFLFYPVVQRLAKLFFQISIKGKRVEILGFVGDSVSVATTQLLQYKNSHWQWENK